MHDIDALLPELGDFFFRSPLSWVKPTNWVSAASGVKPSRCRKKAFRQPLPVQLSKVSLRTIIAIFTKIGERKEIATNQVSKGN